MRARPASPSGTGASTGGTIPRSDCSADSRAIARSRSSRPAEIVARDAALAHEEAERRDPDLGGLTDDLLERVAAEQRLRPRSADAAARPPSPAAPRRRSSPPSQAADRLAAITGEQDDPVAIAEPQDGPHLALDRWRQREGIARHRLRSHEEPMERHGRCARRQADPVLVVQRGESARARPRAIASMTSVARGSMIPLATRRPSGARWPASRRREVDEHRRHEVGEDEREALARVRPAASRR